MAPNPGTHWQGKHSQCHTQISQQPPGVLGREEVRQPAPKHKQFISYLAISWHAHSPYKANTGMACAFPTTCWNRIPRLCSPPSLPCLMPQQLQPASCSQDVFSIKCYISRNLYTHFPLLLCEWLFLSVYPQPKQFDCSNGAASPSFSRAALWTCMHN